MTHGLVLAEGWTMWASLGVVGAGILLYVADRFSMELVSIAVVAALLLLFSVPGAVSQNGEVISPSTILAGFGNPALLAVMALLVVGQGLFQTGALEGPTEWLIRGFDRAPTATLVATFGGVFVLSAFVNNTPVVIMALPVMAAIANRMGSEPSRLMMPLSYISILAGMTTLIGTSTNILAADSYSAITGESLGFFDQTPMGLALAAVGVVYIVLAQRFLLPVRGGKASEFTPSGKQFVAQIAVRKGDVLEGKGPVAGFFTDLPDVTVRLVQRGETAILPPFNELKLQSGDLLIVAATRRALTDVLERNPKMLEAIWNEDGDAIGGDSDKVGAKNLALTEAVLAPGSRMTGRSVEMLGFRRLTGAVVLGIQRRSRMIRGQLDAIRLEAGDTLLMVGPQPAFRAMRASRDLIVLEWAEEEIAYNPRIALARGITAAMVLAAAFEVVSIVEAAIVAAFLMVAAGCVNLRQASRALSLKIYLVIAAALAMGAALEATGAASAMAELLVELVSPFGWLAVLSSIFLIAAVLTNLISNAATAVLLTPVALSAQASLPEALAGPQDALPFLLAVIYGANCSFATPIAYQTNMLVMAPGHYRFRDFATFGVPLALLLWAAFTVFAAWLWA